MKWKATLKEFVEKGKNDECYKNCKKKIFGYILNKKNV